MAAAIGRLFAVFLSAVWLFALPSAVPAAPPTGDGRVGAESVGAESAGAESAGAESVGGGPSGGIREYLDLVGIGDEVLDRFADGRPLGERETEPLLSVLYQLRRLDRVSLQRWTERPAESGAIHAEGDRYRHHLLLIRGRVVDVAEHGVTGRWSGRFGMRQYYTCRMRLEGTSVTATVVTPRVPHAWLDGRPLDEPAGARGLLLKFEQRGPKHSSPVFAAPRIAWYPRHVDALRGVNFGMATLGRFGMDVGLWDDVTNRAALTSRQREPFYQLLATVGRAPNDTWLALAREHLERSVHTWLAEAQSLERSLRRQSRDRSGRPATGPRQNRSLDDLRRRLAAVRRQLEMARKGRSSVVPLFNDPDHQFGQIVLLEGTVRRAALVEVSGDAEGRGRSDIEIRFGFDHYYELDLFTDDSGPNPLIVCVRELPDGFPIGPKLNEPVRMAAFFFKTWAFRSDQRAAGARSGAERPRWQLAPLLIGRQPIRIPPPRIGGHPLAGIVGGGLFVLLLAGLAALAWHYERTGRPARPQRDAPPLAWERDEGEASKG